MIVNPPTHPSEDSKIPSFELKPVLGEGREARWEMVQTMFREKIMPFYDSQNHLLEKVQTDSKLKCRLLLADQQPVGLVIYHISPTSRYLKQGLSKCIEIEVLYGDDQDNEESTYHFSTQLLKEVITRAKENKAYSLCIKVSEKAKYALKFFEQQQFRYIEKLDSSYLLYGRDVEDESSVKEKEKRKLREDNESIAPISKTSRLEKESINDKPKPLNSTNSSSSSARLPGLPPPLARGADIPGLQCSRLPPPPLADKINHYEELEKTAKTAASCPIMRKYFDMIKDGSKTVEGRVNIGMFKRLKQDEYIQFFNQKDTLRCLITKIEKYPSFEAMLQATGVRPCLPDVSSLQRGIQIYNDIPGYAEKAKANGVLAIHIRKV